jgi:phage tail-like protein
VNQAQGTVLRILRDHLPAADALAMVRHVLGNDCRVEFVADVRRQMEGRVVGVRIRPRARTAPITVTMGRNGEARFECEGRLLRGASVEARDTVALLVATQGYGRWLPAVFTRGIQREDGQAEGAEFLRRFLLIFQTLAYEPEVRVAQRDRLVDPIRSDPRFLPWLASWLEFELDDRIPVTRRRIFLRRAVDLFRWRGTRRGIQEMIRTLTGLDVSIVERRGPQPMELGNCALSRPSKSLEEAALPYVTHAREHLLVSPRFSREEYFTIVLPQRRTLLFRHRDRLRELLEQVVRVVEQERPAHLHFVICFQDEEAIHNDLVLCAPDTLSPHAALGRAVLGG